MTTQIAPEGANKHSYRRDIQGLRALAVVVVILDHLWGRPIGGFLGVDVFFVISGFIITSLLLRQHAKYGRISFTEFYKRRVKRILPASLLVLAVTVASSYLVFGGVRAREILTDGIAAALFSANWRFAQVGTDYWADDGTTSPLQHFWSLGVEEQFYFVWPVLIVVVLTLVARNRRWGRPVLTAVLVVVVGTSYVWALIQTQDDAVWAYFSTLTRSWELGAGALVALATPLLLRIPEATRPLLAWLGLVGIAYAIFVTTESDGIPAPGALLAVASTVLVIAAGTGGTQRELWPITNRVAQYIGNISFSLYLWHFPVIVLLAPYFPSPGERYYLSVLAVTALLSVASYHLVEERVRRSKWLERGSSRRTWTVSVAIGGATVVALVGSLFVVSAPDLNSEAATSVGSEIPQNQAELSAAINDALDSKEWPELIPAADVVRTEGQVDEDRAGCSKVKLSDPDACWFPSTGATQTAVVVGDSTGIALLPIIRAGLGSGWNVRGLTMASCPQLPVAIDFDTDERRDECYKHRQDALDVVAQIKPDLVFVTTMYNYAAVLSSDELATGAGGYEWAFAMEELLSNLQKTGAEAVVVGSPPLGSSIGSCAVPGSVPADCISGISETYRSVRNAESSAAAETGSSYIDTENWFCVDDKCPAFVGTTPVKKDQIHISKQYGRLLVPTFKAALTSALS